MNLEGKRFFLILGVYGCVCAAIAGLCVLYISLFAPISGWKALVLIFSSGILGGFSIAVGTMGKG